MLLGISYFGVTELPIDAQMADMDQEEDVIDPDERRYMGVLEYRL